MNAQIKRYGYCLIRLWALTLLIMGITQIPFSATYSSPVWASPFVPVATDLSAMVEQISPVVVNIDAELGYQQARGSGTGIILDPSGIILTNNHVIAGATSIQAVPVATGETYDVDVLGYDRLHDVAVIQLRGAQGLPTADIGDSNRVSIGDGVVSMGNVAGHGGMPIAVSGKVIGLDQSVSAADELTGGSESLTNMIEADTPIKPGDSGGPMVNDAGQVIGMNTAAGDSQGGASGYAIPINQAIDIANQIRSGNSSATVHIGETAFMGIGVHDGYHGARVVRVIPNTPAADVGLSVDDVITSVDNVPVRDASDLTSVLDQHTPGDTVTVAWTHAGGSEHSADVVLIQGPVG